MYCARKDTRKNFTELFSLSFIASNHTLYMKMYYKCENINLKKTYTGTYTVWIK